MRDSVGLYTDVLTTRADHLPPPASAVPPLLLSSVSQPPAQPGCWTQLLLQSVTSISLHICPGNLSKYLGHNPNIPVLSEILKVENLLFAHNIYDIIYYMT